MSALPSSHQGLAARGAQKFDGLVVSDYNAIAELIRHGVAADLTEAAALALGAGVDVDMMSDAYRLGLPEALERGRGVDRGTSMRPCAVCCGLKQRLGLFEDPYRRGRSAPAAHESAARRRARAFARGARALVMLKNEAALGRSHPARRVLRSWVRSPAAAAEMSGPWWAAAAREDQVSVLAGLTAAFGGARVMHAQGVAILGEDGLGHRGRA